MKLFVTENLNLVVFYLLKFFIIWKYFQSLSTGAEFPPDLRARLASHSFPRLSRCSNYYGAAAVSAKSVRQVGFRVIGKMWSGQRVTLDCDRGALVKAQCSCGGVNGGLCAHQLATVRARDERAKRAALDVTEPLSDTVLRMTREQLAAALLEIASPQSAPWLVAEGTEI